MVFLNKLLPFAKDFKGYKPGDLKGDLLSAVTVAAISLPQSMAYAVIAGVDPKYGIYASIFPVIAAALWGSSRFLISGPTNAIAMILLTTMTHVNVGGVVIANLPEEARVTYYFGVTVLSGVIQMAMSLARLGDLVGFVSHSVMVGFTCGTAVLIASGQLKNFFGLNIPGHSSFVLQVIDFLRNLKLINPVSAGIGLASLFLILLLRRLRPRYPAYIISLFIMGALVWLFNLERYGIGMLGSIPQGLPPLSHMPPFDFEVLSALFMPALAIAVIASVESLSVGKNLAGIRNDKFDGNQELFGQGLANIVAGFSSGIAGCGSLSRSAANAQSGARTKFSAALCGLLCLLFFITISPLASKAPMPAMAGILMAVAIAMFDRENMRLCLVATRTDRWVFIATFAATLLLDLEQAIFIGVILSLALFIYRAAHPRVKRLTGESHELAPYPWAADCRKLGIFMIEGTLFFGAINELERQLEEQESLPCQVIVLHLARVFWIDASGAHVLSQFLERCFARNIPVVLILGNDAVRGTLTRTGLMEHLHDGYMANSLHEGLTLAREALKIICHDCSRNDECHIHDYP